MPPYQAFALDAWIQKHARQCDVTLHDSMVSPLTLQELQALNPEKQIISPDTLLTYASAIGKPELRENISKLYEIPGQSKPSVVAPENILVTSGAISANQLVLETLVEPGDHVIIQHPTYNQLVEVSRRAGATVHLWRQQEDTQSATPSFKLDVAELEKQIQALKPKILVLNNPSNPTGICLSREQLSRIVEVCAAQSTMILCDEVFRFMHHDTSIPQPPSILQLTDKNCIATSSLSKAFSLPGLRVGWIAVSSDLRETTLKRLGHSSDYTTISVGCLDQDIAAFALSPDVRDQILERGRKVCTENLRIIGDWAASHHDRVTFFPSKGAGTCVVKLWKKDKSDVIDDVEFVRRLVAEESCFAPPAGPCFGDQADGNGPTQFKGFLRITVGVKTEKLKAGLAAVGRLLDRWHE